ncbi:crossover junction endodeoxyribonuclease RuvC [Bacillus mojavensis]
MQKESRLLWGVDPSLTCTGVTIYDLDNEKILYIGSFNTEKIKSKKGLYPNAVKLKHKYDWLAKLKELYPPSAVAIERGFTQFNNSTQTTYRAHGIVNLMFWDIPMVYYPPKKVKAAIFHGDADKDEVKRVIQNNFIDVQFANSDESDSFAVMLTYLIENGLYTIEKPIVEKKVKKKRKTKKKKE